MMSLQSKKAIPLLSQDEIFWSYKKAALGPRLMSCAGKSTFESSRLVKLDTFWVRLFKHDFVWREYSNLWCVRAITFPHLDVRAAKEYGSLERGSNIPYRLFWSLPPISRSKARLVPIKAKNGYTFLRIKATLADKHPMFSLIINIKENDGCWMAHGLCPLSMLSKVYQFWAFTFTNL